MGGLDQALIDKIISHQIDLLRLDAGIRSRVLGMLNNMQRELTAKLATEDLTALGKKRTADLLKECNGVIDDYYAKLQGDVDKHLQGVGQITAEHAVASLAVAVSVSPHMPTDDFLQKLASNVLIHGAPSFEWWSRQSGDLAFKFSSAVRQGAVQGETNQQIIARIIGTRAQPGIMNIARNNAAALVQSSIQTVANAARLETFRKNGTVVKGLHQLSTLDGNTTDICIAYSGAEWDMKGNPINGTTLPFNGGPPRHWNCRSILVPITKTFKELGINMPEFARSTRASGQGQISATTSFDDWLSRRTAAQQDEQLGKGRAQLWRNKVITLQQLLDLRGNPLTLAELKTRH